MSVIGSNILAGASGQATGYNLTRSLRFRSSASAYITRTPSTPTNQAIWTWSSWVKRGSNLGSAGQLFAAGTVASNDAAIYFETDNTLIVSKRGGFVIGTTQVFRDPSSWYHIVVAYDSTQGTSSNRLKIYVNGSQVTALNYSTYPTLNETSSINSTATAYMGKRSDGYYFDGYYAETNFIDGQALTPSSFGETSSTTGVWQPKKYTSTYGTNGFYLPFTDNSALTSGSNAGLGKDFSGNGNYWNTNNISITSGYTYDSMTDVPTLTSATASNFALCNPIAKTSNVTLSDANLTAAFGSVSGGGGVIATMACPTSGKFYWEATVTAVSSASIHIGVLPSSLPTFSGTQYYDSGLVPDSYAYQNDGTKYSNNTNTSYGASYTTNDVIGVALDMDAGTITFYKNNTSQGTAFSSLSGSYIPAFGDGSSAGTHTLAINFGQRPFAYTPPTGYVALNTYNLPSPTIGATASSQANKYMDALLYTGNGSASQRTDISWANMQPDMVWIKSRSNAYNNDINDDVRGVTQALCTNSTAAEDGPVAFGSDGFGYNGVANQLRVYTSDQRWNANSATYVAWGWKASGAAAVTNTAGSITSTVSANTTSGFSVVTYTGNGTTGSQVTVGHGLGVAPKMVIIKDRSNANNWVVYTTVLGTNKYLYLNTTAAAGSVGSYELSPTSSVFYIQGTETNASSHTYVAYCFSEVAGFSKFGSYTGNGSTDGTFVYTGFRPKFVLVKNTTNAVEWEVYDSTRNPSNGVNLGLIPNLSDAEGTYSPPRFDFLSNGFKLRTSGGGVNGSGNTIIYAAFAEVPTKFALAR